jgi:thiol-disulfide isomerase/thioredoxin
LLFIQCNNAENESISILQSTTTGLTTVTGFVHNREIYPNTRDITINVAHISGRERVSQMRTPISDDGTFRFVIDLARPQDVTMSPFLDFLYLIPGDSLHIELNFADLSDVRLSGGKSAEINSDFLSYFNATGSRTTGSNYGVGTYVEMNASWAEIEERLNEQRDEFRSRRQRFLQENTVHEEVAFLTEAMIELDYYQELSRSVVRRVNVYQLDTPDKNLLMSALNDVTDRFFHSNLYTNAHFSFIASAYIDIAVLSTELVAFDNFVDWAKEVAETEIIRDFMLTVQVGNALLERNLDSFEKFAAHIGSEYLFDRVMQEFRTTRMNMLNPENISSFILHGGSRDFARNLPLFNNPLANAIAPGSGNVQVINIAASWCAPCKPVLSDIREMMDEYADKNVLFHFISITDNEASRIMYIERGIDLSLVHFATEDETSFLMQTFSPFGLPYGILINRQGVIVDYGSHLRHQLLRERVNLLLKQDNLIR